MKIQENLIYDAHNQYMRTIRASWAWLALIGLCPSSLAEPRRETFTPAPPIVIEIPTGTTQVNKVLQFTKPVIIKTKIARTKAQKIKVSSQKNSSKSVSFEKKRVRGININIVRVNLWDKRVFISPILPAGGFGRSGERFDKIVAGSSALAVINGGYFHPRTFSLTGDLVFRGRHLTTQGPVRTALTITSDNLVRVQRHTSTTSIQWKELETAISNGPWILRNGKIFVYPRLEGYKDRAIERAAARSAIGITSQHKLFFVSTRQKINLYNLAKIMKSLGAREAITLDGGSSTGLSWRGKVIIRPARKIAYGIGVYIRP